MADKKPEPYEFSIQSDGITLTLSTGYSHKGQLAVRLQVAHSTARNPGEAFITLKDLTIMVRALNDAKDQHDDGSDHNA